MFDTFIIYFFLSTVGGKIFASPYTLTLYYNIKELVLANYRQLDSLYPMKFVISNHHAHVDFLNANFVGNNYEAAVSNLFPKSFRFSKHLLLLFHPLIC